MTQPKQVTQSLNLLNAAPDMYAALVQSKRCSTARNAHLQGRIW